MNFIIVFITGERTLTLTTISIDGLASPEQRNISILNWTIKSSEKFRQ